MSTNLMVMCESDLVNSGTPFPIPFEVTATLRDDPAASTANAVQLSGVVTIGTDLVNLVVLLNMGADATISIDTLAVDMDVAGATPTVLSVEQSAPLDVTFMQDVPAAISTEVLQSDITLDAAGSLTFTLGGASLSMSNLPGLGSMAIPLDIPGQPGDTIYCQLPDPNTPITFTF